MQKAVVFSPVRVQHPRRKSIKISNGEMIGKSKKKEPHDFALVQGYYETLQQMQLLAS